MVLKRTVVLELLHAHAHEAAHSRCEILTPQILLTLGKGLEVRIQGMLKSQLVLTVINVHNLGVP